jgi:hypothetical protein
MIARAMVVLPTPPLSAPMRMTVGFGFDFVAGGGGGGGAAFAAARLGLLAGRRRMFHGFDGPFYHAVSSGARVRHFGFVR